MSEGQAHRTRWARASSRGGQWWTQWGVRCSRILHGGPRPRLTELTFLGDLNNLVPDR